jgi:hypothetical protein
MRKMIFLLLVAAQLVSAQELALVRKDERFGYINKTGDFAIQPKYKVAKNFSDGLAAFEDNGKWGYINMKGDVVIPATFDEAKYFDSGISVVAKDKKWFYINKRAKPLRLRQPIKCMTLRTAWPGSNAMAKWVSSIQKWTL